MEGTPAGLSRARGWLAPYPGASRIRKASSRKPWAWSSASIPSDPARCAAPTTATTGRAVAASALPVVAGVGAAHLAGSDGMLALLQAQGFRLEAIRMRLAPG